MQKPICLKKTNNKKKKYKKLNVNFGGFLKAERRSIAIY